MCYVKETCIGMNKRAAEQGLLLPSADGFVFGRLSQHDEAWSVCDVSSTFYAPESQYGVSMEVHFQQSHNCRIAIC